MDCINEILGTHYWDMEACIFSESIKDDSNKVLRHIRFIFKAKHIRTLIIMCKTRENIKKQ